MLLAHQGGWDEGLLVIGPLALLAVLLDVARRRANKEREAEDQASTEAPPE